MAFTPVCSFCVADDLSDAVLRARHVEFLPLVVHLLQRSREFAKDALDGLPEK